MLNKAVAREAIAATTKPVDKQDKIFIAGHVVSSAVLLPEAARMDSTTSDPRPGRLLDLRVCGVGRFFADEKPASSCLPQKGGQDQGEQRSAC